MDQTPAYHNPYLHDLVWALLESFPCGRLLDIPSGPGYFARRVRQEGFDPTAAEIDKSLHVFPDISYVPVDMAKALPFADQHFDYIVSIEGIEHIENQFLFLRECARILRKQGRLFMTTPNVSSLESRLSFFLTGSHDNPPAPIRDDLPNLFMEHVNLIPFHRLEAYLRFAGLKIEVLRTYRLRKGSLMLYPLVYPIALVRFWLTFKKYFKTKPRSRDYWRIFRQYLTLNVLCGSHIIVVAKKS